MKKYILLILFFLFCKSALAQKTKDYFPMEVGNKWYYVHCDPNFVKYGEIDSSMSIVGKTYINDTLYYEFTKNNLLFKYCDFRTKLFRKDSLGNVYGRCYDKDQLLFRVKYVEGDIWYVYPSMSGSWLIKIWSYSSVMHDFPIYLPFTILNDTCYNYYEGLKCEMEYVSFRMYNGDDVTLTLCDKNGIVSGGSNLYEQYNLIRFTKNDSIITPKTFVIEDYGIKNNCLGLVVFDLFDSSESKNISLTSRKAGELTPKLVFEPGEDPYYLQYGAYYIRSEEGFVKDDTITVILSGEMKDIMGNKLDGNQNGIPEGSPLDDFKCIYLTKKTASIVEKTENPSFKLYQNYPNPFNPETTIKYSLAKKEFVNLSVYDILGREIATLIKGYQLQGVHDILFNAKNLPSGVYFYKIHTSGNTFIQRMMLIK